MYIYTIIPHRGENLKTMSSIIILLKRIHKHTSTSTEVNIYVCILIMLNHTFEMTPQ